MQRAVHLQAMTSRYAQAWAWVGAVLLLLIATMAIVSWPTPIAQGELLNRATLVSLNARLSDAAVRKVTLPHVFDDEKPQPISGAWRYRFEWPSVIHHESVGKAQALLISRVGARFRVWMDGQLLYNGHWETDGYVDTSVVPHLVVLPDGFDPAVPHQLDVDVHGVLLRKSGMGLVQLGPLSLLQDRYDRIYWWQVYLTWMVAASAGVLALLSSLVWYASRDKVFGLFAIAAFAWMVRQALTPLVHPMMGFELWFFLHKITFTLYCGFIYLFLWHLYALKHKLARQLVLGLMTIGPLWIAAIVAAGRYDAYRLWTACFALVAVIVFGLMLHRARWGFDPKRRMMVVTGVVMLVTGLRDFFVVQLEFPGDADLRWMTPGSMLFMLTLGLVLMQRVGSYVAQINQLNMDLERRVEQKERELTAAFEALREVENKQVLVKERARLTRDMHDGLGSQLVQTLNAVRAGQNLKRDDIQTMLAHALEELRMTIDSMEEMEGDLPTILGTLRRRIGPSLETAGIVLRWDVHEVPVLLDTHGKPLEAKSVMHLFRCLQEIFANIIKHARATEVVVSTSTGEDGVVLTVTDNGQGMQRDARDGGHGLANIRARAAAIGAHVDWKNLDEGGTRVRLIFSNYGQSQQGQ